MTTPLIELKNVRKDYDLESGSVLRVLDGVNLSVNPGDFVALLGPSGSGKSTCLRIMGGLIPASKGEVFSRGGALMGMNRDIALVFQSFALFPWETVYANIALALEPLKLSQNAVKTRVKKAIDMVGLEGFEEAYPRELSGGMKQRVGIARAMVMERSVLFLDEPFSALDILTADTLRAEVVKIFLSQNAASQAMVLVTHNIQEAVFMSKRILVMGTNPGRIRAEVVNDLAYPRDERSTAFRRMVSQIHALITETLMPDQQAAPTYKPQPIETLPQAQINQTIGLLEAIADKGGTADIFELAQETGKDFGSTLYLVKAAELFDLVETPKQLVVLTDMGQKFVRGDINTRKKILHDLFGRLQIVQMTTEMLRVFGENKMSVDDLVVCMQEWLPNENPKEQVETLISWGRFAEYLGYNDDAKEIYLDTGMETN